MPVADPVAEGLKVTVNGRLCPGAIVAGSDKPVTLNAALLVVALLMLTLAPEELRVPDAVTLLPTTVLPIFSVDGVTESWPTGADVVPVADNGMLKYGPETARFPLTVPGAFGANVTFTVTLCLAASVKGVEGPVTEKPVPAG